MGGAHVVRMFPVSSYVCYMLSVIALVCVCVCDGVSTSLYVCVRSCVYV